MASAQFDPQYANIESGIIDSHAHLLREFFADEKWEMIDRAFSSNVRQIVNPGINADSIQELFELAERYENIYIGMGVHPHDAKLWNAAIEAKLEDALKHPKVVAVGECGLDFYYNNSEKSEQIAVLRKQIELSIAHAKPLIIHCRDAWDDIISIFSDYKGQLQGVFHCFTGNADVLHALSAFDFYISFSGIITFPNAKPIQEAAKIVDSNRLLVETDCPFLAPQRVRGKRNEPAYVWYVAEKLAELRGSSLDQIARACTINARHLFRLPAVVE
jgi:TatD DNase family protein